MPEAFDVYYFHLPFIIAFYRFIVNTELGCYLVCGITFLSEEEASQTQIWSASLIYAKTYGERERQRDIIKGNMCVLGCGLM